MKKFVVLALVALVSFSLFANGSTEKTSNGLIEKPAIYYCAPRAGGVAWNQSKVGFEKAVKDYGFDGQFLTPMDAFNNIQIIDNMNIALNNGAHAVLFGGGDVNIFGAIIKELKGAGILVGSLGNYADFADFNVAATFETRAATYFKEAEKNFPNGKQMNILYLSTNAGEMSVAQLKNLEKCAAERGNAKIVNFDFVAGDAIQGADKTAANVSAYPEINCIIVSDATGSMGVATWIKENHREDIFVVTEANSSDILLAVNNGYIDTSVYWEYTDMGYKAAEIAYKWLAKGEKVGLLNDPGYSRITKENVKQYATERGIAVTF